MSRKTSRFSNRIGFFSSMRIENMVDIDARDPQIRISIEKVGKTIAFTREHGTSDEMKITLMFADHCENWRVIRSLIESKMIY